MIDFEKAVASLLKSGAKQESGLIIKNITVTDAESYTRVALTLDREIDGVTKDENGNWTLGKTNIVFVSLFSIAGLFKAKDETMAIGGYIVEQPSAVRILLSGATISVALQTVGAHQTYVNPWTDEEKESDKDYDSVFVHLIDVKLGDKGSRAVEKIEDKLLGL